MGKGTAIEWADDTFSPWLGCSRVGPECDHCYAAISTPVRVWKVQWGPHVPRRIQSPDYWRKPLRWNRQALAHGAQELVFCASESDVFEDRRDLDLPRAWLWPLIEATPGLVWALLTKRPAKALRLVPPAWLTAWPRHVWVGTSVGCRASLAQIDHLRAIPAPVRFLSCEPLLEALPALDLSGIHWVIAGGESGPHFRPPRIEWVRDLRDQVKAAGLPFFFKQWGGRTPKAGGKVLDGCEWCEVPLA